MISISAYLLVEGKEGSQLVAVGQGLVLALRDQELLASFTPSRWLMDQQTRPRSVSFYGPALLEPGNRKDRVSRVSRFLQVVCKGVRKGFVEANDRFPSCVRS